MHPISFELKRSHLKVLEYAKKLLAAVPGMTPARFDILCFARQRWIRFGSAAKALTTQRAIREALGLHASTISKMLKRLEEMGWIARFRDYDDPRVKGVELTPLGLRKTWEAMRRVFRGRLMLKPFEAVARALHPTMHVLEGVERIVSTLEMMAACYGDSSTFYYDFGSPTTIPFRFIKPDTSRRYRFRPRIRYAPAEKLDTTGWANIIEKYTERMRAEREAKKRLRAAARRRQT